MLLRRTAKIKLNLSKKTVLSTFEAYTKAFNFVCQVGFPKRNFNGVKLHQLTYAETREYLPSQLAISARMKATEAIKGIFKKKKKVKNKRGQPAKLPRCPQSKFCSIRYDARSYTLNLSKQEISLLTINGRIKTAFYISDYHKNLFQDWKYTSADLCLKKNKIYLHIVFEKEVADVVGTTNKVVGVDRGINNLAVTSERKFYSGKQTKRICNKRKKHRQSLKEKGTRSAKRHLRKLSGKERQFKADVNHQISKAIVSSLNSGDTIVLENLSGIRNHKRKKRERTLISNWNFFQLEQFIVYKSMAKGINVVHVDPRFTSQRCLACSNISRNNRKGCLFCCKKCSFKMNADLVAAKNIVLKYLGVLRKKGWQTSFVQPINKPRKAEVNKPIVSARNS